MRTGIAGVFSRVVFDGFNDFCGLDVYFLLNFLKELAEGKDISGLTVLHLSVYTLKILIGFIANRQQLQGNL